MSEFAPTRESIEEILNYSVAISEAENGAEQRRLIHANAVIGFKIKTPSLTKTQMAAYRSFFIGKYGVLTSFTFTNPFDDTEYTVRFVPGSFKSVYSSGYFQCEFDLARVP